MIGCLLEILNKDVLTSICIRAPYRDDHSHLLSALSVRYPGQEFFQVAERGVWSSVEKGLCAAGGDVIANSFRSWVNEQYEAAGQDAKAVWQKHKDSGLVLTEWRGSTIYIAAPYGPEPDAFIQIEVKAKHEVTCRYAFEDDPWAAPDDLDDLLNPMSASSPEQELQPWRYELRRIVDIRRFVREMVATYKTDRLARLPEMEKKKIHIIPYEASPVDEKIGSASRQQTQDILFLEMYPDWVAWEHPCTRLLRDWVESSAGHDGRRFCEHWYLQVNECESDGKRQYQAIPQWADRDGGMGLPEIHPGEEASPLATLDKLNDFDRQAGYPFAWYFYMLHGNRISDNAGQAIVRGLKNFSFRLSERDEKVLLRWAGRQYGF